MSHDEVVRGDDQDASRSYGWFLVVGLAVVAAVVSILGHHSKATSAPPQPLPSLSAFPTPSASAAPSPTPSASPSAIPSVILFNAVNGQPVTGYVEAQDICTPTTKGSTLSISFVLQNLTSAPERMISVSPDLPLAGLKAESTVLRSGTCAHPTGKPGPVAGHILATNGTAVITMTYGLPKTCAQPLPVLADVSVILGGFDQPRTQELRLFNDLSHVRLPHCPPPSTG